MQTNVDKKDLSYDKPCETGHESSLYNGKLRMWQAS